MRIELTKKPKGVTIIEGFPGFGMVSTISTEFLVEHLKAEPIGQVWDEKLMPLAAIHGSKVLQPIEIFYCKQHNLVILHALSNVSGLEWKISDVVIQLAKDLEAKQVIGLEGVGSQTGTQNLFYFSNRNQFKTKLEKLGLKPLSEGIVMGVTGALLLKTKDEIPFSSIFVETTSNLPDSKGAAKLIKTLDGYLGLKVDYKPLLKVAQNFEGKLKGLIKSTKKSQVIKEKKEQMSYLG